MRLVTGICRKNWKKRYASILQVAVAAAALAARAITTRAALIEWTGTSSTAWGTGGNWMSGSTPGSTNDALFDQASYTNQPTINAANSVAGLIFGDGTTAAGAVTIGSGNSLTIEADGILLNANTGAATINGALTLGFAQAWTNNASNLLTVAGNISNSTNLLTIAGTGNTTISGVLGNGSGGLSKSGTGTLILSGTNTYTGITTIDNGIMNVTTLANVNTASSIGKGSSTGSAADLIFGGGTLQYTIATPSTPVSTNRLFTIGDANGNSATLDSSSTTAADTLSFTSSSSIAFTNATTHTLTLTGSNSGTNTFAPIVSDQTTTIHPTSLIKNGAGKWDLTGANTYTGGTTITLGTLMVGNVTALGGNSSPVSVTSGAVLDLNGTTMTGTNTLTLNGTGISSGGALTNSSGTAATYVGSIILGSTSSIATSSGTISVTGGIALGGNTLTLAGSSNITIGNTGAITGTSSSSLNDGMSSGILALSSSNPSFSGSVTLSGIGSMNLTSATALNSNNPVNFTANGTLNLSSVSETIQSLSGSTGTIQVTNNPRTLTLAPAAGTSTSYSGIIGGSSNTSLVINGTATGTQTLSGVNSALNSGYTGGTTIIAGVLRATTSASSLGTGPLTLSGGELQLANASGSNLTFGGGLATTNTANAKITSDVTVLNTAGDTFTLGTLGISGQTLTIQGGSNVNSGTAGITFGTTTFTTANSTFTINNPAAGGNTLLTLGAVTNSTFTPTIKGNGNLAQTAHGAMVRVALRWTRPIPAL